MLDSSFLIDLQRKDPMALAALHAIKGADLIVPGQAVKEFAAGFDEPLVAWHIVQDGYRVVLDGEDQVLMAARLHRRTRSKGLRAPWADTAVAAQAQLSATYVVSANPRDFQALGCRVWDYRKDGAPPA